jgi:UDP-3-O-[3-hydroxymyristoyl] glucosamine N-acyltransferase
LLLVIPAQDLVSALGGSLQGSPQATIQRFASLAKATSSDASFLANPKYQDQLKATHAGVLILKDAELARAAGLEAAVIETPDPYLYFAQAATWMLERTRAQDVVETQVHPTASIHPSARVGQRVRISPHVVIEDDVLIADDVDIGAGTVIESGVRIGAGSTVAPRVTIGRQCVIGCRAVIHSGVVIGSDGFGFAPRPDRSWLKIPQVGAVWIGDDVEIGANTTIDRGTLDDTRIGHGVKLDNQIQIAHNVVIGDHTAIAACVGIAGSAVIGAHCQIAGAAGVLGHLTIAEGTVIGPMSLVMSSIDTAGKYVGVFPLQAQSDWERSAVVVRRLPELRRTVQNLKKT